MIHFIVFSLSYPLSIYLFMQTAQYFLDLIISRLSFLSRHSLSQTFSYLSGTREFEKGAF